MNIPRFSLGSWAFSFGPFENDPWSFDRFLEYAAAAGYDGVEINGFRPHPHPDDYATDGACAELKARIEGLGLGISGYAPDFRAVPPAEVELEAYLAELEKFLVFCGRLGIRTLRVDSASPPIELAPDDYERRFERITATWRAAAACAARDGVTIVWEFEPGFWLNKPSEVLRLVEAVDHPAFRLLYDTSHAHMGAVVAARQTGEPERLPGGEAEYAEKLRDVIGHIHLIDCDGTLHDDETSTHSPFGTGNVDFPAVLKALSPVWDDLEWCCFDFCFCATTEADAAKAIPYVRELLSAQ
ncbi:MAG: sugar phosphate isomerase/epimerase [Planctomycetota bacterium]|nr:sugar phosphate isomerase/epimerase [Planctomycetota bacterium]